jgi:D-alanyl-D-alanine dipeptidase
MNKYFLLMPLIIIILILIKKVKVKKPIDKKTKTKIINKMVNEGINKQYASANKTYIDNLNPVAKSRFTNFINDIISLGYGVVISSGYRDSAKQAKLKKENSKNASAGFSTHEYGLALDLNLVKDGKWLNKNTPLSDWIKTGIIDIAKKKYNMRWGGEFTGYLDPIHFDMGKDYDVNKLYAQAIKIYKTPDKIQGNKLNLV